MLNLKPYLLLLLSLNILLLTGCFNRSVKLGVALPLSGSGTPRGQEILNGVLLAVEDVNRHGGVQGKQVEVIYEDDQDAPTTGQKAASALIDKGVIGVVGHYSSDVTLAVLPQYREAHTALVSPSVALSKIPDEGEVFFRTIDSNVQQARAAVSFIQTSGFTRVAVVRNASLYGQDLSQSFQASLKAFPGIKTLALEDKADSFERLRRYLPELIFYAGGYQDAAQFLLRLREAGIQTSFMGGNTLYDPEFIRLTGLSQAKDVWIASSGQAPPDFYERYRKRFGRPGPFSAYGYDAARLLLSAADQSKRLEPEAVRAELAGRTFYHGLTGAILLEPNARSAGHDEIGILTIGSDGNFVSAEPIEPLFSSAGKQAGTWAKAFLKPRPTAGPKPTAKPSSQSRSKPD